MDDGHARFRGNGRLLSLQFYESKGRTLNFASVSQKRLNNIQLLPCNTRAENSLKNNPIAMISDESLGILAVDYFNSLASLYQIFTADFPASSSSFTVNITIVNPAFSTQRGLVLYNNTILL